MTSTRQRTLRIAVFAALAALILVGTGATAIAAPLIGFGPVRTYNYNAGATGLGHNSVVVDSFSLDTTHGALPDIVVPNGTHDTLSFFSNLAGNGTFATGTVISNPALNFGSPAFGEPDMVSGDFNASSSASGFPDLLVTNQGNNSVAVLLGNGVGGFTSSSPATVSVGSDPVAIASADFNGDSRPDFITANSGSANVSIRDGNGDGTFSVPATASVSTSAAPLDVVTDDFNGDTHWDFAVTVPSQDSVRVFLGNGLGGFTEAPGSPYLVYSTASPVYLQSNDFNGDGISDIITSNANGLIDPSKALTMMLGTGTGAVVRSYDTPSGNTIVRPPRIATGILQSQSATQQPDVVAPTDLMAVLLNAQNGTGALSSIVTTGLGAASPAYGVALGDVNGDGPNDIIAAGTDAIAVQFTSTTAPVTTAFGNVSGWDTNWIGQDVQVSLVATEPIFGVASTWYNTNGGPPNLYSIPVTFSAEGTTTLGYWSVNTIGFTEPTNTVDIRIDKTPPTMAITGVPAITPPAAFGWTNQQVTIALNPADTYSGVANSLFTINGSGTTTYTVPLVFPPLSTPGTQTITAVAIDNVGLHSVTATAAFGLDAVVPSTTLHPWGAASTGWINASSTPGGWTFTRTEDGLSPMHSSYWLSTNGAPLVGPAAAVMAPTQYTFSGEGTLTVSYQTTDLAGNIETTQTGVVLRDTQLPTSTISGIPSQPTSSPVTFSLSATDATPGSGVAAKYYTLDSNPTTQTYSSPVTVSGIGNHTIHYWAADVAGNVEGAHTSTFTIWPPSPTTTISGVPVSWVSTNVTFTLDATSLAPTFSTFYTLNGGATTTYTAPVGVTAEGTTTVVYWSVDSFGQVEAHHTAFVRIDKTAPITTSNAVANYVQSATITVSAVDTMSGVASKWYSVDGATLVTYTAPVVIAPTGHYTFAFGSVDNVGNRSATQTVDIAIHPKEEVFAGADRYESAVLASRSEFPSGSVGTVIIATGENFPDALSAGPLAGAYGGPVLLTRYNALPVSVRQEIMRLGASHAIVVGGTGAVSAGVQADLASMLGGSTNVVRKAGQDRYGTAAIVAETVKAQVARLGHSLDGTVFIATGTNFPDALAAGPNAWNMMRPILLVKGATIPQATSDELASLAATRAVVLGGSGVIPTSTVQALAVRLHAPRVTVRLGGSTRYDTAVAVANWSVAEGQNWGTLGVATGQAFADALAGGAVMGHARGVMLLTTPTVLSPPTEAAIQPNAATIQSVKFFGGDGAVSPAVRASVMGLLP